MGNKSEPPACVKDGWWQGRCFCLEKMGLLCSTAVVAEKPGNMSDRKCLLTSSNLSLPSLSPSCPPSPVYSSILLSHNIFLFLSSPPHLSFPSTSFFLSLFLSVFSLCLSIPGSVFPLCLVFFFFSCLFVCFLHTSSCSIHLLSSFSATNDISHQVQHKGGTKGRPGLLLWLSKAQGLMAGANRETTNLLRQGKCHPGLSQHLGELLSNVLEKGRKLNRKWSFKVCRAGWKFFQAE